MTVPNTAENKYKRMTETPIPKLLFSLAVPTILSMLISAIYNMADTYFIGMLGSASATARGGRVFPDDDRACRRSGLCSARARATISPARWAPAGRTKPKRWRRPRFSPRWSTGVVLMALGLLFLPQLVVVLGSTETIAPYAIQTTRAIS